MQTSGQNPVPFLLKRTSSTEDPCTPRMMPCSRLVALTTVLIVFSPSMVFRFSLLSLIGFLKKEILLSTTISLKNVLTACLPPATVILVARLRLTIKRKCTPVLQPYIVRAASKQTPLKKNVKLACLI
eukprot:Lithocolla_globosa_v1_NODE_555_length_3757_cov_87.131821.p4 type:complete len:128 gc:universal NODE_555_length_3757_cov_87.131821:2821-3204(+)